MSVKLKSMRCVEFATLAFAIAVLVPSCGGPAANNPKCAPTAWSGYCELRAAQKVEDRELPIPHVIFEAVYAPQVSGAVSYVPPEVHERMWVAAQYEVDLLNHLQKHRVVQCQLPQAQGSCIPTRLAVAVPPFDPAAADAAREKPKAPGCGQIESTADQERLAQRTDAQTQIAERFLFEENSSSLSPDNVQLAQQIAAQIKADPNLECVAVVGQSSPGENPSLPHDRARVVRELLVSFGVDRSRLLTVTLTASVFGPGAKPGEADPTLRRVSLKVLLEKSAAK